jgi:hypothetical protein
MVRPKQALKRRRRGTALPVLGAAGVSFAMTGAASATAPSADIPSQSTTPHPVITLGEEEISDVSLATFYVFNKENAVVGQGVQLARGGGGGGHGGCGHGGCRGCGGARGCGGCGGRGCGGRGCRGGCGCAGCGGCGGWWGGCSCCLSWGGCSLC